MLNSIGHSPVNRPIGQLKSNKPLKSDVAVKETEGHHDDIFIKISDERKPQRFREEHNVLHEGMEAAHIGAEVLETLEVGGALAAAGTIGAVASGVYFGIEGAKDMKLAIKEKDTMGGIAAGAHLALAGEAGIGFAVEMAELHTVSSLLGPTVSAALHSPVLHALGTGFGVAHAAGEVIVGGKEIYEGIKEKDKFKIIEGAFETALGVAVGAVALGGGAPVGIALAAIYGGKMFFHTKHGKKLKLKLKTGFNRMFNKKYLDRIDREITNKPA